MLSFFEALTVYIIQFHIKVSLFYSDMINNKSKKLPLILTMRLLGW